MASKFRKKLVLSKETVANLDDGQMKVVIGGSRLTNCNTCHTFLTFCDICTYACTHATVCAICTYDCH